MARILGNIPDGTPPPPSLPQPQYHVPTQDILDTKAHQQGGRTITIRQIKPIALPSPPAPVAAVVGELDAEYSERLAEYREAHPKSDLLFLSVTVFRSKSGAPRSLVRYWPQGTGTAVTFWSSADFSLIAGGINSFVDAAGGTHHLFMGWGSVDIDRMRELYAAKGRVYHVPELPDLPDGKAIFQFTGEQPAAGDLVAVQSLHDLYNNEYDRLKTAFKGRERARIQQEADLKANPPQPKDITLNYWRTEKPATTSAKGAVK